MKAAVLEQSNTPIVVRDDVEIMDPRPGEVRVNVKYCGVCHSDLSTVNGTFEQSQAIILGHEASGIVEKLGEGVTHLAVGDHVILTPAPPCGRCYFCVRNEPQICESTLSIFTNTLPDGATGLSLDGQPVLRGLGMAAFAEYVVIQANGAVKIPKEVPLEHACVIGCAMQTGVGAVLNTAKVDKGDSVLIMGLGGVGMAAVQGARISGATTIIVSDPVAKRRELAKQFGATHLIDPTAENVAEVCMRLTEVGVDYAFETAGVAALVSDGVNATRSGGLTVCVGAPSLDSKINIDPAVIFASTEKKLCGCFLGSCNSLYEIPRLIRLYQAGQLDLASMITNVRPLEEINEAMEDLTAARGIRTVMKM
ncbi:MAG: Zn-dependent alcohol dehydrogenase [Pseudomonadales bacterium]